MEKAIKHYFNNFVYSSCIFSLVLSPFSLIANEGCDCYFCEETEDCDEIEYEELGEFEQLFREFEEIADAEDEELTKKEFFIKKWCRKVKRWFKKRVASLLKKIVGIKDLKNPEECAYTVAKFKRDVDKKVYKTGGIEELLKEFDKNVDSENVHKLEPFKNRVRFYYYNDKVKPKSLFEHNYSTKDGKKNDLDNIPVRALIGGVEVACGCLIRILPFPGCYWLGWGLISHGSTMIAEAYIREAEKQQEQQEQQQHAN